MTSAHVYLHSFLAPLARWLEATDITDLVVNRPGEIWVERAGAEMTREEVPALTEQTLQRLARQIAASSHQGVSRDHPLVSATLPDGARVQIVAPPATRGGVALGIRRHAFADLSLDRLDASGMFSGGDLARGQRVEQELEALRAGGDVRAFLEAAVRSRKTLLLSGGTASGKTTLLNALLKCADPRERLIVIEDAPELTLDHANILGLIASRGQSGEAQVSAEDLLQASMRLRPDRILLGELRGREAFSFLRAVNTGHPGSITTIHADDPVGAIDQIAMLTLLSGVAIGWDTLRRYATGVIDYVVQLGRTESGARSVMEIARASDLI